MIKVDKVKTVYTTDELCASAVRALTYVMKRPPNKRLAVMVVAYLMFETGWAKSMWNNNPGNVRPWDDSHSYIEYGIASAPGKYRAFATLDEGMQTYVYEIARRRQLTQAGIDGDFNAWAVWIRDSRYCPDCDPAKVQAAVSQVYKQLEGNPAFANLAAPAFTWTGGALFPKAPGSVAPSGSLPSDSPALSTWPVVVLRRGSRGGCVFGIQQMLGIKEDGIFGPKTEDAVKVHQRLCGQPDTGIVTLEVK